MRKNVRVTFSEMGQRIPHRHCRVQKFPVLNLKILLSASCILVANKSEPCRLVIIQKMSSERGTYHINFLLKEKIDNVGKKTGRFHPWGH